MDNSTVLKDKDKRWLLLVLSNPLTKSNEQLVITIKGFLPH
jgi:hypothetical protein